MDVEFALWGSITHRSEWDLMWGERETPHSGAVSQQQQEGFNQEPPLSPPEGKVTHQWPGPEKYTWAGTQSHPSLSLSLFRDAFVDAFANFPAHWQLFLIWKNKSIEKLCVFLAAFNEI